jgi:hypothetical protein
LSKITFESGSKLREIGPGAFAKTDLGQIRIPYGVEFIGEGCFSDCDNFDEITFEYGSDRE